MARVVVVNQSLDLLEPVRRIRQIGNAQIEGVFVLKRVPAFEQDQWTVEIRFRGKDRLGRNAHKIFDHDDRIHMRAC